MPSFVHLEGTPVTGLATLSTLVSAIACEEGWRTLLPHHARVPRIQLRNPSCDFKLAGVAKVIYCLLDHAVIEGDLEVAMIEEYKSRTGNMPAWNRTKPNKTTGISRRSRFAEAVLDRLAVGRPK